MNFRFFIILLLLIVTSSCGVKKRPKRGEDKVIQSYVEELKSQPETPVLKKAN